MSVIQRLFHIAKPYRSNLLTGLSLVMISTFLDTVVISALLTGMITLVDPKGGSHASAHPGSHNLPINLPILHNPALIETYQSVKASIIHGLSHFFDPHNKFILLVFLALVTLVTVFCRFIFSARSGYLMNRFANLMAKDLRLRIFGHLMYQPPAFYEMERTGTQVSRITSDVAVVQQCLGPDLANVFQAPLTIIFALCAMIIVSWRLMVAVLCLAPLIAIIMSIGGRKIRKVVRRMQERSAEFNAGLIERLSNIRVIQSFVREKYEIKQVSVYNTNYYREIMHSVLIAETLAPGVEFIAWIGMVLGVVFGGYEVLHGHMQYGQFFFFMFVAQKAGSQFKQISRINQLRQQANAAGERIFSTLDIESEIAVSPTAYALPTVKGDIRFEHLSFQYNSGNTVLSDIDFTVKPGEVIALVGPSGSGKTTMANLLPRFYDPTAGRILIDGHDLRDLTLDSLREQVGIVPQETLLFSGSIRENILYGKLDASEEELLEAARSANALNFINDLPDGFETVVGERGTRLSGGQRQRVAIARALLKNPRILILDEATSALDTESEHLVQQALDRLMQNRTTFVIAHRLSTVKDASRLLVLDHGKIVESGTHEELLALGGLYSRLYEMQFHTSDQDKESPALPV
ncbi:MAG TPA: ABC transporter ATP-binding protein [Armatimonadota bacterium]|nr:ABC transporter ATP-binding protein [Armatimonadota bacterium]